jgi:hypothetical protein
MAMIRTGHKPEDWTPIGPARGRVTNSGGVFGGPIVVARNQVKSLADSRFAQRDYNSGPYAKPPIRESVTGRPWLGPRCGRILGIIGEPCARAAGHQDSCRSRALMDADNERRRTR